MVNLGKDAYKTVKCPDDKEPFPFGKPKANGDTYGSVKASYYLWLMDQDWIKSWPYVMKYIETHYKDIVRVAEVERKEYERKRYKRYMYDDLSDEDDYRNQSQEIE